MWCSSGEHKDWWGNSHFRILVQCLNSRVPQLTCIWMSRSKWVGKPDYGWAESDIFTLCMHSGRHTFSVIVISILIVFAIVIIIIAIFIIFVIIIIKMVRWLQPVPLVNLVTLPELCSNFCLVMETLSGKLGIRNSRKDILCPRGEYLRPSS